MSLFDRHNRQEVTLWSLTGMNSYNEPTFDAPVALKMRWEEKTEEIMTPTQESFLSRACVFVSEDVTIVAGDWLALGDLTALADPTLVGAYEVKTVVKIPSLRTNRNEVRAYM